MEQEKGKYVKNEGKKEKEGSLWGRQRKRCIRNYFTFYVLYGTQI